MNKTLFEGDKLLVIKTTDIDSEDVLVFSHNQGTYVKRLMGLPGDTIQIIQGILYVNHKKKTEKYVNSAQYSSHSKIIDPTIMNYYGVDWTVENFGPYIVPKKGDKIILNNSNIKIYKSILKDDLNVDLDKLRAIDQGYNFKQDYYFMLGDNRLFSEDSRMYGPVKKEDIIGTANLILYSKNNIMKSLLKKI